MQIERKGRMSKSVYVRVFNDLELLRLCSSLCDRTTALISGRILLLFPEG